jgi:hypothetical protein
VRANVLLTPKWSKSDYGRYVFKEALRRTTPEVLDSLHQEVLPIYKAITPEVVKQRLSSRKLRPLGESGFDIDPAFEEEAGDFLLTWYEVQSDTSGTKQIVQLNEGLQRWSQQFNLDAEWILDAAVQTLFTWSRHSPDQSALKWGRVPGLDMRFEQREFNFSDAGWNGEEETWKDFEDRVTRRFKKQLQEYRVDITNLAVNQGWTERHDFKEKQHFDWLALYQVRQTSPKEITKHFSLVRRKPFNIENTVFKAVGRKAKLIGLTLRPPV